ncbi:MAG TPA: formyltransferase family protein [Gaiellaceae bacterium]|nr:formyltransferase family protein [Gaiellaceae bacterium]
MKVGFICSNYYAFPAFRRLLGDPRVEPVFVVGLDESRFAASGMRPFYYQGSRFFAYALGHPVESHLTTDLNADAGLLERLEAHGAEYVLAMGWPDILSPAALGIARGIVGVHPSRLPEYRGGAPLNWQLLDGARTIGVSSFFLTEQVDAGNVIVQRSYAVPLGNAATLIEDVYEKAFVEVLDETIERLAAGERGTPLDLEAGFYRPRRRPEDGRLAFDRDAGALVTFVRALCFPFPGAFFDHGGRRVVWNDAALARGRGRPGEVLAVDRDALVVACASGAVRLSGAVGAGDLRAELAPGDVLV